MGIIGRRAEGSTEEREERENRGEKREGSECHRPVYFSPQNGRRREWYEAKNIGLGVLATPKF